MYDAAVGSPKLFRLEASVRVAAAFSIVSS